MKSVTPTIIIILGMALFLFTVPTVTSCGWFTYEDIPETRAYYDITDTLTGVQDSILLMSRTPTPQEIKKNVYIPMIYNGGLE